VVLVAGQRVHAEALWQEVSNVLSSMGLRLSVSKTRVTHVEEGFDFLGWRLQRRAWKGRPGKRALYTYPAKAALRQVMDQIRALTRRHRHRSLSDLLRAVNRALRGWGEYFRHGVSKQTFCYLDHFTWGRVYGWLMKRHPRLNRGTLVARFLPHWQVREGEVELFRLEKVPVVRYRFRGTRIPTPWTPLSGELPAALA
jgi:RNA-directed DNA polymerase